MNIPPRCGLLFGPCYYLSPPAILVAPISRAQMGQSQPLPVQESTDMQQTEMHQLTDVQNTAGS